MNNPRSLRRLGLVCLAVLAAACGVDEPVAPGTAGATSSSIVLLADGRLAVADPDQGSVSFVDPDSLEELARVDVGGEPHALLEIAPGRLAVTTSRSGEIALVDAASLQRVAHRRICAGARGMAAPAGGAWIAVACEWSGEVRRVDPATLDSSVLADHLSRPRAVAVLGPATYVAGFTGGSVTRIDADGTTRERSLVPGSAPYRPALTHMTANLAAAVLPLSGRIWVAHELVNNTGDEASENVAADYGSVTDGHPKINPALSAFDADLVPAGVPATYARFDGGSRVYSGPSALAALDADHVLVAHVSTHNVALVDTRATDPERRAVATFSVGAGPEGIAVDAVRRLAWVDNAFDGSVTRIDLSAAADKPLTRVRALPGVYSPAALAGRKLFYDASNPHVTPSGVVACATCHPGGHDDGLVWFIHTPTIPLKRRRTPDLANAHSSMAPFHWSGEFATLHDLAHDTITDLMAGDALLVQVDTIQAFVDEIVAPPVGDPGDPAAIERGRQIFDGNGRCASCHRAPDFTDNQSHAVLSPESLRADDVFSAADTPGLRGVFLRAPYFHDGRSPDLRDLLTRPDAAAHGTVAPGDVDDLLAYLRSL